MWIAELLDWEDEGEHVSSATDGTQVNEVSIWQFSVQSHFFNALMWM